MPYIRSRERALVPEDQQLQLGVEVWHAGDLRQDHPNPERAAGVNRSPERHN